MKIVILSAMLLAAAGAWSAGAAKATGDSDVEARDATAAALERLTEARRAFEDALAQVESVEFRQIFDEGAMLGVVIRDRDDDGVQVVGVTPDSGAEAAGILVDDLIVAINDRGLGGRKHPARLLRKVMDDVEPGDAVRILLIRDGDEHAVDVEATRRPHRAGPLRWHAGDKDISVFPSAGRHRHIARGRAAAHRKGGLRLKDIGEDLGKYFGVDAGVLVFDAPPGSALKPGDVLRRIDDADIGNADEAYRLLADLEETGEATVRRENRIRTVEVEPLEGLFGRAFAIMMDRENGSREEELEFEVEVEKETE